MIEDTRDIAIGANVKVDAHVQDCIRFRAQIADSFRNVNDNMSGLADKITGLQVKAALLLGGLIVLGKISDYVLLWVENKK